jgi:hypothetical protein
VRFKSREDHIHDLVERAWRRHSRITVYTDAHRPHCINSIVLRETPSQMSL